MIKKILLGLLVLIVVIIGGFVTYVQTGWDATYDIPYPELESSTDSTVIAHGKYLVRGPAHCSVCHVAGYSELVRAEMGEEMPLQGGVRFPLGPLGAMSSANLTPDKETGIGRYSDGEVFRMMRHAVKPDGTGSLAVMMPFWNMADEDLIAVVSYLRSLEPIRNEIEEAEWTFVGKAVRTLTPTFKPIQNPTPPQKAPLMAPTVERGKYLANYVANCVGCHTPRDPQTYEATGPEFSGGFEFEPIGPLNEQVGVDVDLWTRSPNITPHPNSAFSKFNTLEDFIQRFRGGRVVMQSPMQWGSFANMSDADLEAIWLYLNSLDPVEHDVGDISYKKE